MLRRTSQSLGRKAAEKMGIYLPPKFSSILEPNRHFASLKVPASKDTKTVVGIGRFPPDDYIPSMFLDTKSQQNQQQQSSSSMFTVNSDDSNNNNNINKLSHSSSSTHSNPLKKLLRIMVITSEGLFYTFGLDPERGGDCILLNQYSLLNDTINTSA
ncbi:unnamed protein product [[Candida] boidinii]|uniref:Unnamed protein product n=1 Tax=Candida boidinii TaxID=5477 RepID=A0ACB5TW26_CANBO|nr:unnamed protein product [[Candida] boidinii]